VCKESATAVDVRAAMPHPVAGSAADPIALEPVDDDDVTTLVDDVYDALLTGDNHHPSAVGSRNRPSAPVRAGAYQRRADGRARLLRAGQAVRS
jgi:7,8-dihydropterin-6-yl-methyl-4-(beta-D-ribofuranosyl)aminobenzene 5'-phosphate synthase